MHEPAGDTGGAGDVLDRDLVVAALGEQRVGRVEDLFAPLAGVEAAVLRGRGDNASLRELLTICQEPVSISSTTARRTLMKKLIASGNGRRHGCSPGLRPLPAAPSDAARDHHWRCRSGRRAGLHGSRRARPNRPVGVHVSPASCTHWIGTGSPTAGFVAAWVRTNTLSSRTARIVLGFPVMVGIVCPTSALKVGAGVEQRRRSPHARAYRRRRREAIPRDLARRLRRFRSRGARNGLKAKARKQADGSAGASLPAQRRLGKARIHSAAAHPRGLPSAAAHPCRGGRGRGRSRAQLRSRCRRSSVQAVVFSRAKPPLEHRGDELLLLQCMEAGSHGIAAALRRSPTLRARVLVRYLVCGGWTGAR